MRFGDVGGSESVVGFEVRCSSLWKGRNKVK